MSSRLCQLRPLIVAATPLTASVENLDGFHVLLENLSKQAARRLRRDGLQNCGKFFYLLPMVDRTKCFSKSARTLWRNLAELTYNFSALKLSEKRMLLSAINCLSPDGLEQIETSINQRFRAAALRSFGKSIRKPNQGNFLSLKQRIAENGQRNVKKNMPQSVRHLKKGWMVSKFETWRPRQLRDLNLCGYICLSQYHHGLLEKDNMSRNTWIIYRDYFVDVGCARFLADTSTDRAYVHQNLVDLALIILQLVNLNPKSQFDFSDFTFKLATKLPSIGRNSTFNLLSLYPQLLIPQLEAHASAVTFTKNLYLNDLLNIIEALIKSSTTFINDISSRGNILRHFLDEFQERLDHFTESINLRNSKYDYEYLIAVLDGKNRKTMQGALTVKQSNTLSTQGAKKRDKAKKNPDPIAVETRNPTIFADVESYESLTWNMLTLLRETSCAMGALHLNENLYSPKETSSIRSKIYTIAHGLTVIVNDLILKRGTDDCRSVKSHNESFKVIKRFTLMMNNEAAYDFVSQAPRWDSKKSFKQSAEDTFDSHLIKNSSNESIGTRDFNSLGTFEKFKQSWTKQMANFVDQ